MAEDRTGLQLWAASLLMSRWLIQVRFAARRCMRLPPISRTIACPLPPTHSRAPSVINPLSLPSSLLFRFSSLFFLSSPKSLHNPLASCSSAFPLPSCLLPPSAAAP
eukprot:5909572-Pleurochrysis_carterae.AAC.1